RTLGRRRQPVRPLRALPRVLSDLLRARHRDGFAARAHLHDQVASRGPHVAQRIGGETPLALSRLPRVRDRLPGRRAVRAADRSGQGRYPAPAGRRAAAPPVPLAELRAAAGTPTPAAARRGGRAPLPDERPPAARPEERPREAPAGNATGLGGAAAVGAVEGGADAAATHHARRRSAAGA